MNLIFCIDNITGSTLWSKAAANPNKTVLHYIEESCCPPKRSKTNPKNLRTLAHTHHELNIRRHLRQHPARQPPKTNPKNLRTLTPILEVRTPTAKALWGASNAHVDEISRSPIARLEVRTPIRGKTVFYLKTYFDAQWINPWNFRDFSQTILKQIQYHFRKRWQPLAR